MNIYKALFSVSCALVLSTCAAPPTPPGASPLSSTDLEDAKLAKKPTSQAAAEKAVVAYFSKTLKDPESARFTYMPMTNGVVDIGGGFSGSKYQSGWFVCGTINAKNSYGGYVGQRAFFTHFARNIADVVDDGAIDSGEYSIVTNWCQKLYGRAP